MKASCELCERDLKETSFFRETVLGGNKSDSLPLGQGEALVYIRMPEVESLPRYK